MTRKKNPDDPDQNAAQPPDASSLWRCEIVGKLPLASRRQLRRHRAEMGPGATEESVAETIIVRWLKSPSAIGRRELHKIVGRIRDDLEGLGDQLRKVADLNETAERQLEDMHYTLTAIMARSGGLR